MTLWVVPIEPLSERYSAQWGEWWQKVLPTKTYMDIKFVWGEALTDKIEHGSFLDVVSTNHYKASQLMKLLKAIHKKEMKHGDWILFHDLWFPGLEMLAYARDGLNTRFMIYGCLHAGTYDPNDFLSKQGMGTWGKPLEECWFKIVDGIFVATVFHAEFLADARRDIKSKLYITGFPLYWCEDTPKFTKKKKIIVFPHRLDEEKRPDLFDRLKEDLKGKIAPSWQFVKTMDVWDGDKKKYYALLKKASIAVSFAEQETWGIAMQESLFSGCIPVVPDKLSYREMYEPEFRYLEDDYNGAVAKVAQMCHVVDSRGDELESISKIMERNIARLKKRNHGAIDTILYTMKKIEDRTIRRSISRWERRSRKDE